MYALVLCAGLGTRLAPLTGVRPKPLIPLAGRPLVAYTLDRLAAAGCTRAVLNTHHLGDQLPHALGTHHQGMELVYSPEEPLLGSLGALAGARSALADAETLLVVNGDSLCAWPLRELLARHQRTRPAATLLFSSTAEVGRFGGGVPVTPSGEVLYFPRATPHPPPDLVTAAAHARRWVFAGAQVLDPALLARAPQRPTDLVLDLYARLLQEGRSIQGLATRRRWFDLGTPASYLQAALISGVAGLTGRRSWVSSEAQVASTAQLARSLVEAAARVEAHTELREVLVLPGATVGRGTRLARCLVSFGARVPAGFHATGQLLAPERRGSPPLAGSREAAPGLVAVPLGM